MSTVQPTPGSSAPRLALVAVALALFAGAMWFAWLGWDDDYYLVDGVAQGPYRPWQVVGCGLSVAIGAVAAMLALRGRGVVRAGAVPVLTAAALGGFALPWSVHAAATDDSGLWAVGLFFLLVGGGLGLVTLLTVTAALAGRRSG
ncbi:hypothetical protein [Nocardioides solisilvae]|uniref:hypothetical protein n=1 Tax=Nocardioides solisilvae TaxID=1542435 RepID=UPI000D74129A|nr:hypothetical protein [Nocardioides solisilvae]